MNYGPKPLIEDHYHIRDLIEVQEKRASDRTYHQNRIKESQEHESLINDSKWVTTTDFWCKECNKDFKSQAVKQVELDWTNSGQRIAFYKTKCFRGHWCIRLISDRHRDSFWSRSKLMALDRGNHFADTVQPYETGFNLLYGKK